MASLIARYTSQGDTRGRAAQASRRYRHAACLALPGSERSPCYVDDLGGGEVPCDDNELLRTLAAGIVT